MCQCLLVPIHQISKQNWHKYQLRKPQLMNFAFKTVLSKLFRIIQEYRLRRWNFANNSYQFSLSEIVFVLCGNHGNAGIAHYSSWKCKHVTRSILAAEVYALIERFDFSFTISSDTWRRIFDVPKAEGMSGS